MSIDETIQKMIDQSVDRAVEAKLPEMIRALGLHGTESETEELVGAVEVARLLGRDLSSPEKIRRAKKHVYNLARQDLIPSVRLSERCVRFDLAKVKRVLAEGGKAKAA